MLLWLCIAHCIRTVGLRYAAFVEADKRPQRYLYQVLCCLPRHSWSQFVDLVACDFTTITPSASSPFISIGVQEEVEVLQDHDGETCAPAQPSLDCHASCFYFSRERAVWRSIMFPGDTPLSIRRCLADGGEASPAVHNSVHALCCPPMDSFVWSHWCVTGPQPSNAMAGRLRFVTHPLLSCFLLVQELRRNPALPLPLLLPHPMWQ